MNSKVLFAVIGSVLVILIAGVFVVARPTPVGVNYDEFAKCLTDKGLQMYGTASCVYCQRQKKEFGSSFQYIKYTDCILNPKACTDAGVESTPTWTTSDGTRLVGQQPLSKLSEVTSCSLPTP